ncbi:MAG: hypothetical protein IJX91_04410 [Clostridia bacterium]|nr:hypothetical protein [Clostridia bacterium]
MKTCEQHSREIFCEIARRERASYVVRKRVKKAFAAAVILGIFLPAAVYFSTTEEPNRIFPLSFDFTERYSESPSEDEESEQKNETVAPRGDRHDIALTF